MNIITEYEVVRYSPAHRDFPIVHITPRIPLIQQQIGREKLGYEFYLALVDDLSDTPTGAQWERCGD